MVDYFVGTLDYSVEKIDLGVVRTVDWIEQNLVGMFELLEWVGYFVAKNFELAEEPDSVEKLNSVAN
jgi:hypothetical protein